MPELHVTRLDCIKKRDWPGKDEIDIYLAVDGGNEVFVSGPHHLDKSKNDDSVDLSLREDFTNTIRIRLKERNGDRGGNNDLDLGAKTVDSDITASDSWSFQANNGGVYYTLYFHVDA